jgi:hypothetical protein
MPFAGYKDFEDCKNKNKDKDTPDAYCGYIKNQVEGGAKKEEALDNPEHEAFHLEEGIKRMEEEEKFKSANSVMNLALKSEDEKILEEEIAKLEEELKPKSATSVMNLALKHDYPEDKVNIQYHQKAKEPDEDKEVLKEASVFVETLKATVDEVTLMAKDQGWDSTSGVSDKVAPTEPTYKLPVSGEDVNVALKEFGGMPVKVNWFNTTLAELKDIVKDANSFFEEAGWNSKEVVKEYNEHKKHWGKDYTAGT